MKHYFLTGVSAAQKASLNEQMVVLTDMHIDGQDGIMLDEENKNFALKFLGMSEKSQKATTYAGIILVVYGKAEAGEADQAKPNAVEVKRRTLAALDADHERYRQLYMAACSSRINELIAQNRQELITRRLTIEQTQKALIRELRALRLTEGRSCGMGVIDREVFLSEFEALVSVPRVKDIRVEDGSISVYTEMLFADDPRSGKRHELGEFVIQFLTDGQADCVRWYNLTRRVNAGRDVQQAPHVYNSGRSCLHMIKDSLVDLVSEMQFAVAAQLAIDFIEQVDVEEPDGAQLDKWPEPISAGLAADKSEPNLIDVDADADKSEQAPDELIANAATSQQAAAGQAEATGNSTEPAQ